MSRRNIFQIAELNNNFGKQAERICRLFEDEETIVINQHDSYDLKGFIESYCFEDWKNRGYCIDLDDFLDLISYNEIKGKAIRNFDYFLTFNELVYNFYYLAKGLLENDQWRYDSNIGVYEFYSEFDLLHTVLEDSLTQYNYKAFYNPETEQLLVIEDKPEVTAVAEIIEEPLALAVIRYNHHSMKGDLSAKKDILLKLGSYLEGKRDEVKAANSKLESIIFIMLNSLNIRHNNCDPSNKGKYKQVVADMTSKSLEKWYDELYQMILLVILEMDNKERMKKFEELKKAITGGN